MAGLGPRFLLGGGWAMAKMDVGLRRRLVLLGLGLKPGDLSTALGTTQQQTTQFLSGYRPVPATRLPALKRLIGQRLEDVFLTPRKGD